MPWTDSHGRPELVMHPDIKRGGAKYRHESAPEQASTDQHEQPAADGEGTNQCPEQHTAK